MSIKTLQCHILQLRPQSEDDSTARRVVGRKTHLACYGFRAGVGSWMTVSRLYQEPSSERQCSARRLYRCHLPCPPGSAPLCALHCAWHWMHARRADTWVSFLLLLRQITANRVTETTRVCILQSGGQLQSRCQQG